MNFNNKTINHSFNSRIDTRSLMSVSDLKLDYDLQVGGYKFLPKTSFKTILNRIVTYITNLTNSITVLEANTRPYKVYTALLTQTGTNAPVATVLENTLGVSLTPSYSGTGIYDLTRSSGTWDTAKTTAIISQQYLDNWYPEEAGFRTVYVRNNNSVRIVSVTAGAYAATDGFLGNTMIEIRVYP